VALGCVLTDASARKRDRAKISYGRSEGLHGAPDPVLSEREFQFEWDETKAAANIRKHGVSFELAASVFADPRLLSIADLKHSETEERWFSVGCATNGVILSVVYVWHEIGKAATKIRLISARPATKNEIRFYEESL
jgi:uncharacterized DUF497 family protein